MPPIKACPERNDYERLIHGELPLVDVELISQHLAGCSSCAAVVQTLLAADTLLSGLRSTPINAPEVPADLARRLLALAAQAPDKRGGGSAHNLTSLLDPPQATDEIGRLAHYRVLKVLGEGGMGLVYLAEDTRLGRAVALKTMKPELAADPRHRQRFLREARAAAKVEHDNIVPIYSVGDDRGVPWLAMPFLKGQSLDELLNRVKVLKPTQAMWLGVQVAKGLAAAHAAGLIHRDVKPANIWVEPESGGRAKLLDFGLARDQNPPCEQGQEDLTRTGTVAGTPAFMAPEQANGETLDARVDLFSLGCVLYRMVTGRLPFQGRGMMDTLRALATETPPDPHEVNSAVPQPLSALIMRLLAKDRSARPPSAAAVVKALEALRANLTSGMTEAILMTPSASTHSAADLEATEPALPSLADPHANGRPRHTAARHRLLVAASVLGVLLGSLLLGQIVIKLYDDKGRKTAEITVPQGGKTVIEKNGKPLAILPKGGEQRAAKENQKPATAPDRLAAEWVLSIGDTIYVKVGWDKEVKKINMQVKGYGRVLYEDNGVTLVDCAEDLPPGSFKVVWVHLARNRKVSDAGLEHLKSLPDITTLDLSSTGVSDAGLEHLKGLTNLKRLHLPGTRVSDAGLEHLKGLTNLAYLSLGGTRVSDTGMEHLKGLTNLTFLNVSDTPLGDAGLKHLKGLTKLTILNLGATRVSDAGSEHLKGLTNLEQLYLSGSRVTAEGVARLQKTLPQCRIFSDGGAKPHGDGGASKSP